MKKIRVRTISVLFLVIAIIAGLGFYIIRYVVCGKDWVTFVSNGNAYENGCLKAGSVLDKNGEVLAAIEDGARVYADDWTTRVATLHAVGDRDGNIGTGALSAFASDLVGYNLITGLYSLDGNGGKVKLTINAELNRTAYEAMAGRSGCVAVMNYKTGEVLCMVSTPSFDPADPPEIAEGDTSGVYINRFLSSSYTPGSVFKLVTLAAAIENIDDLYDRTFSCNGAYQVGGDYVTCTHEHGEMKIEDALAVSCNGVFAQLALELGADTMEEYAAKLGLTASFEISDIPTSAGTYEKAAAGSIDLAWSGVGQYNDAVNPAAMLRYMASIANDGVAVDMKLKDSLLNGKDRFLSSDTAKKIAEMMDYCVYYTYGDDNFPGLDLCAKSGTAEVGGGKEPNAWFAGFIKNEGYPLAFVVMIENGGWGSSAAGSVANSVLQAAIS